jgi:hypothetical protein
MIDYNIDKPANNIPVSAFYSRGEIFTIWYEVLSRPIAS